MKLIKVGEDRQEILVFQGVPVLIIFSKESRIDVCNECQYTTLTGIRMQGVAKDFILKDAPSKIIVLVPCDNVRLLYIDGILK